MSFLDKIFGKSRNPKSTKNQTSKGRRLRMESLENRELLSVSTTEFGAIRSQYSDLELSANMSNYNVIEITASQLSGASLRNAIATAASTTANDLIVVRTMATQNKITLDGTELAIEVDSSRYGSVTIVGFGAKPLTLDADQKSRIFSIGSGAEVALAGLTITGGNANEGGGIYVNGDSTLTVTGSTISENTSQGGGGIFARNNSILTVTSSTISKNTAADDGGGIHVRDTSTLTITNSEISKNKSINWNGGGIFNEGGVVTVTNCTIVDNTVKADGSGILLRNAGTLTLNNTIVVGNTGTDVVRSIDSTAQGYNNLTSFTGWNGNFSNNLLYNSRLPLFVDTENGDYRLTPGSQAIDTGNNDHLPAWLTADLEGNARKINGIVDIGAYEANWVLSSLPNVLLSRDTLKIYGNDGSDWIEIEETATQIIVHAFSENRASKLDQWAFTKGEIAMIEFYGGGGDDTFMAVYDKVSISIACRIDGGTGNNRLIGGSGNDWIYGGEGNSHLDGGKGDNIIIGGHGYNLFYNRGGGSNCYIWAGYNNQWANGHSNDGNDGFIIARDTDRGGGKGNPDTPYRQWTQDEILGIGYAVRDAYPVTGTYALYNFQRSSPIYCVMEDVVLTGSWWAWASGPQLCFMAVDERGYPWAFYHEMGHTLHYDKHPFWSEFRNISWNSDDTLKDDAVPEDFNRGVLDEKFPTEEWADIVNTLLWSEGVPEGRSEKFYQKIDLVLQLFAWIRAWEEGSTVVTTLDDVADPADGQISLREAIQYAKPGDTITFAEGLQGKITLGGNELYVDKNITIDAAGADITIDADQKSRVFRIGSGATVALAGLTITGGNAYAGGGIYVADNSTLTVTSSTISKNTAADDGGGIHVRDTSTLTITNSEISKNKSINWNGGGIFNEGGVVTVTNCTIVDNTAKADGSGILLRNAGTLTLNNTIVVGNTGTDVVRSIDSTAQGYNNLTSFTGWNGNFSNNLLYNSRLPLFVDTENGDYRLATGSQAIDRGRNALAVDADGKPLQKDLDGKYRIADGTVDIGAYEYQTTTQLTAPTLTAVTAIADDMIGVLWNGVANAGGYVLQYATNSTFTAGSETKSFSSTARSTTLDKLNANTTYYVRIMATGTGSYTDSDWSAVKSATISGDSPTSPANFRNVSQTVDSVTLSWSAQENLTEYTLQYKKSSESSWTTWTPAPEVSSATATVAGLAADTMYDFRLTATNAFGSAHSTTSAKTDPVIETAVPDMPATASAVSASGNVTKISWSAVDGATLYEIMGYNAAGNYWWKIDSTTETSYTAPGYSAAVTVISVHAVNEAGRSAGKTTSIFRAPANVSAVAASGNQTQISWNAVAGANRYEIMGYNAAGNYWWKIGETSGTSHSAPGYTANVTTIAIHAIRGNDRTSGTATSIFRAPTTVSAVAASGNRTQISWNAVAGATSYDIMGYNKAGNYWWKIGTTSDTSFDTNGFSINVTTIAIHALRGEERSAGTATSIFRGPENVSAVAAASSTNISWSLVPGATLYEIMGYNKAGNFWWQIGTTTDTSLTASAYSTNVTTIAVHAIRGTERTAGTATAIVR